MALEALILSASVALWAVVHSWLASVRVKEFVRRRLGEGGFRAYRLAYDAFSLISLMPIAFLAITLPDKPLYSVGAPWKYLMWTGQLGAAICLALALLQTGPLAFAGLAQLFGQRKEGSLVTSGFYGLVRHPLYLFGLLFLWLTPSMSLNQLGMNVVATVYFFVGAKLEERRLTRDFGAAYEAYIASTPMLLPFPRMRKAPR